MRKILVICGPTAVGKTALALNLGPALGGELISADCRQVYRGMNIGTGKDLPPNSECQASTLKFGGKPVPYYSWGGVNLWGYDAVFPNEEWSPADFAKMAVILIRDMWGRNKTPIIVGGDGFYIKTLINPPPTLFLPPDKRLRARLEKMDISRLQGILKKLNVGRFNKMNRSDQCNPRRLIRAIETSQAKKSGKKQKKAEKGPSAKIILPIGLTAPIALIDKKIRQRVKARLSAGLENEVRNLVDKYGWNRTLMSTIAYREWRDYFEGRISRSETIGKWMAHERQYARRQITWFKKQVGINWFSISRSDLFSAAAEYAKKARRPTLEKLAL